ncbi:hypothetical protein FBUS_08495 [Fasciolopsis buskii]|uniref:Uncharacterized protein n=1 Tax=Fasciolopsis buskii TaxID=27845 RepID=A0A8E0RXA6_9TREM|nr:hypothetical protein FBUS_08495 [Fasciolopsis buski]
MTCSILCPNLLTKSNLPLMPSCFLLSAMLEMVAEILPVSILIAFIETEKLVQDYEYGVTGVNGMHEKWQGNITCQFLNKVLKANIPVDLFKLEHISGAQFIVKGNVIDKHATANFDHFSYRCVFSVYEYSLKLDIYHELKTINQTIDLTLFPRRNYVHPDESVVFKLEFNPSNLPPLIGRRLAAHFSLRVNIPGEPLYYHRGHSFYPRRRIRSRVEKNVTFDIWAYFFYSTIRIHKNYTFTVLGNNSSYTISPQWVVVFQGTDQRITYNSKQLFGSDADRMSWSVEPANRNQDQLAKFDLSEQQRKVEIRPLDQVYTKLGSQEFLISITDNRTSEVVHKTNITIVVLLPFCTSVWWKELSAESSEETVGLHGSNVRMDPSLR